LTTEQLASSVAAGHNCPRITEKNLVKSQWMEFWAEKVIIPLSDDNGDSIKELT
jgi:hypothetical protein